MLKKNITNGFASFLQKHFFVEPHYLIVMDTSEPSNWKTIKGKVSKDQIKAHFSGGHYLGLIAQTTAVRFFIFDLDNHQNDDDDLLKRYNRLIDRYNYAHVITKTPGNGLHLYYFLDSPIEGFKMKSVIEQQTQLRSGKIEFYPSNNGIRLFGGLNCPLLDNNLIPIATTPLDIENHFMGIWENIDPYPIQHFEKCDSNATRSMPYHMQQQYDNLIKNGLTEHGSRNESMRFLNYCRQTYMGDTQEEAKAFMDNWLANNHNGYSKEWKESPQKAKDKNGNFAKYYDPTKQNTEKRFYTELLTDENKMHIEALATQITPGLNRAYYKILAFLEDMFAYCKRIYSQSNSNCMELPSVVLQKCSFGSKGAYKPILTELLQKKVLILEKNYSTKTKRARRFKIRLKYII